MDCCKKSCGNDGVVYLIKKDGTSVGFEEKNPSNTEILNALNQVSQAFKNHFKQYKH